MPMTKQQKLELTSSIVGAVTGGSAGAVVTSVLGPGVTVQNTFMKKTVYIIGTYGLSLTVGAAVERAVTGYLNDLFDQIF